MSTTTPQDNVHRLIDMIVEEVSLVDRAANNRQFLIVKRDLAMGNKVKKTVDLEKAPAPAAGGGGGAPAGQAAPAPSSNATPYDQAVAALDALTNLIEQLDAQGTPESDQKLLWVVGIMQVILDEGAEGDMPPAPEDDAEDAADAAAQGGGSAPTAKGTRGGRARALPSELADMQGSLAKIATALRSLTDTVKQQQQRIGRVEKQSGLPNSTTHAERTVKATALQRGWPLDLNRSLDWEEVDETSSFHE